MSEFIHLILIILLVVVPGGAETHLMCDAMLLRSTVGSNFWFSDHRG